MGDNLVPNGLSRGLQGFLLQVEVAQALVFRREFDRRGQALADADAGEVSK